MSKGMCWFLLTLGIFCGFLITQRSFPQTLEAATNITVDLSETAEAFKNPMKGFRPSRYHQDSGFTDREYSTIYKHYIAYSLLESTASDSVQKIKDWSNSAWAGIENRNIKVIPRVFILYPNTGEFWGDIPHDGTPAQWTTDVLKNRLVAFAAKLGEAWDNDPRVAAVEMGLWGKWGEHNIWPDVVPGTSSDRIPESFQSALGTAFTNAFHNKKVMVRYENTFTSFNFGYIWDSFALPNDMAWANFIMARDTWKTQMISGEVAYDWGDQSQLGGSPNGTLSSNSNTDYVIGWIRNTHNSSLGWIAEYTPDGGVISANAARMQKAFGYRYVITQVTFSNRADQGLSVSFDVSNAGNAPFYYNWPVEASLLRADKSVAWTGIFNADIRNWLPGSSYTVSGTFNPTGLANGTYTLALAVLDPAGNRPSLRFANTNYYTGGRTPVGKVGFGQDPSDQNLGSFNGLKADNTLSYSLTTGPTSTPAPTSTPGPTGTPAPTPAATSTPTPGGGTAYYEAEAANNTLAGAAVVTNEPSCSGGKKVGYLGNGSNNYLIFNGVNVTSGGSYTLTIYYLSAETRTYYLGVNGGSGPAVICNSSGGWSTVGTITTTVALNTGNNTIKFYNNDAYCPDLDRISINGGGSVTATPTPAPAATPTPTPTGAATPTVAPTPTPTSTPTVAPTSTPAPGAITIDSFPSQTQFGNNQNDLGQGISWVMDSCYYGSDSCGNVVMCTSPSGQYFQENINQSLAGKTNLVLSVRDWWDSDSEQHWNIVLNDGADHTVGPISNYGNITASYVNITIPLSAFGANLANAKYLKIVHKDSIYAVLLIDSITVN